MLVFGPLLILLSSVMTFSSYFSLVLPIFSSKDRRTRGSTGPRKGRPKTPMAQYSAALGPLSQCVSVSIWFVRAKQAGLYRSVSPQWRKRHVGRTVVTSSRQPPAKPSRKIYFYLSFIYLAIIAITTMQVWYEITSLASLCSVPLYLSSVLVTTQVTAHYTNYVYMPSHFSPKPVVDCRESSLSHATNTQKLAMLCAWQSSNSIKSTLMDYAPGSRAICVDTGASACISNNKEDFVSLDVRGCSMIQGIGSGLSIAGMGTLKWVLHDDDGQEVSLFVRDALYVPAVPMCLLCPQQIAQQTKRINDGFFAAGSCGIFTFDGFVRTISYSSKNGLPIFYTAGFSSSSSPSASFATCDNNYVDSILATTAFNSTVGQGTESNLSRSQMRLLQKHKLLCHLNMDAVQKLARDGKFGPSWKDIGSCEQPCCLACMRGKLHRRPVSKIGTPLTASYLKPGDCIFADQIESNAPGKIATFKGSPRKDTHRVATLYVDAASKFCNLSVHGSTTVAEAILTKNAFERTAKAFGVTPKHFHGDNGVFACIDFKRACDAAHQTYDFSAVDAHWQNLAERYIRIFTERARTSLLDAISHWPDIITQDLWPFALKLAVDVHNNTPGPSGLTPTEIFCGAKDRNRLADFHPFGCPVFVLEASLRQGHKLPKWQPRSRMAVYLGNSPDHAVNAPLVLNTRSGLVSPQYHVVFDDSFTTTKSLRTDELPSNWLTLFNNIESYLDPADEAVHVLSADWRDPVATRTLHGKVIEQPNHHAIAPGHPIPESPDTTPISALPLETSLPLNLKVHPKRSRGALQAPSAPVTRSQRVSTHPYPTRFKQILHANIASLESSELEHSPDFSFNYLTVLLASHDSMNDLGDGTPNESQHFAFAASNEDTLHYGAMKQDDDRLLFEKDMRREISDLEDSKSFTVIPRDELPENVKPVPSIWSFRRKRAPDWSILKWKARLCPHGGKQVEGENYWETYAPVVTWSTVRLVLILSLITGLKSRQCDFVAAYTQAPLDTDIFMNIPAGFIVENGKLVFSNAPTAGNSITHVIRLLKNLYGLRQAGANWYDTLKTTLLSHGFQQSTVDPCLFLRKDLILVLYVDDCLLFARTDAVLDDFLSKLKSTFSLTSEMDVGAFLGIDIIRNPDGFMELTQPGLIRKIIQACGLDAESKRHDTPAITTILRKDENGAQREHAWKYRTLIGMLTYLSVSSRPDIAFAVHQCARYSVCPMRIHELAVRRVVRYLQGTSDKGYILRPSPGTRNLDCYVDADFAGMWDSETSDDPASVKSRTGYVITFANCPVLWASKLQTEIALSTTEAEYIALSQAMRDLIPMRTLLTEIATLTKLPIGDTIAHSTVFEDNKGCVELANAPKMRPRTKHISIKYHHFRSHVARGDIKIQWISTNHQLADIFTKPLAGVLFHRLRFDLLGW